jgi:hypothetical protein
MSQEGRDGYETSEDVLYVVIPKSGEDLFVLRLDLAAENHSSTLLDAEAQ